MPAYRAVEEAIRLLDPDATEDEDCEMLLCGDAGCVMLTCWNDSPGRRQEDVVHVLALARRLVRWEPLGA